MSEPLKPCPFCETVVEYPALHEDANEAIMFHPRPEKGECILGGYSYGFDPEQWNNRPGEEAARLHELNDLREYFPLTAGNHYEGMQKRITERIAELGTE